MERPDSLKEYAARLTENRLKEAGERLRQKEVEIETRKKLSDRLLSEIDDEVSSFRFSLSEFRSWGVGYNKGVDMRRNQLERLLFAGTERRRREELRAWDDIARLQREADEARKEYEGMRRVRGGLTG